MLHRLVSIGLFALLLCHSMACVIVAVVGWWQDEHDLSERLLVYRSVDSIVEFQIPLRNITDGANVVRTTEDGFSYRGHDYNVISLEVQGDMLHIAGLETTSPAFWQRDLLTFLDDHLTTSSDSGRKANQLLKFLLKEYSPGSRTVFDFSCSSWRVSLRIPELPVAFVSRAGSIHSPPPELLG